MHIKLTTPLPKVEFHGQVISSFVFQHLLSACIFAKKVKEIEEDNDGKPFGEFFTEVRSYASAAIMASAAAIEANINELYIYHSSPLRKSFADFEQEFWGKRGIENLPVMKKYLVAFKMLKIEFPFEKTLEFENAHTLVVLRNSLVHFKPNWDFQPEDKKSELHNLKGKFNFSKFVDEGSDLVSMKCMTYGSAKWSLESAISLIDKFSEKAGLLNKVERFRNKLKLD